MHRLTCSLLASPVALVLTLAQPTLAQPAPAFDVVPKFVQESEFLYDIQESVTSILKSEVMERGEAQQRSARSMRIRLRVLDVNDQGALVELTYQSISLSIQSELMRTNLAFDTSKPVTEDGANPLAPVLRPLMGAPITFQVSPGGNISNVKMQPGVVPSVPMARIARQFTDEATLQNRLAEIFTTRSPERAQSIGATWSADQTLGSAAPGGMADALRITWTMTLAEADLTKATIDHKGNATIAEGAGSIVKPELQAFDSKGTQVWDPVAGIASSFELTTRLSAKFQPQPNVTQTVDSTDQKKITRVQ